MLRVACTIYHSCIAILVKHCDGAVGVYVCGLVTLGVLIDLGLREMAHDRLNLVSHAVVDLEAWTRHRI